MSEMFPDDLLYSEDHEWLRRLDGGVCRVGITAFAQDELGEVVFVDLPEVGQTFEAGDELGSIESVKAVAEIYSPIGGEVVRINETLEEEPERVNADVYGDGWLVELRPTNEAELEELMDAAAYEQSVASG